MKPKHEEHCRVMGWWPLWMTIDQGAQEDGGGGRGCQGGVWPTQRGFQADSKPLRPEALCFVTSLLEHNANANEEPLRNWRRWWDGTLLLIFDTSAPPYHPLPIPSNPKPIQSDIGKVVPIHSQILDDKSTHNRKTFDKILTHGTSSKRIFVAKYELVYNLFTVHSVLIISKALSWKLCALSQYQGCTQDFILGHDSKHHQQHQVSYHVWSLVF